MTSIRDERKPHDLYRFYDAHDRLLYIGISLNAAARASQHKKDKSWWHEVRRMDITPLGVINRYDAEQVERAAIQDEQPVHNVIHNTIRNTTSNVVLIWECEICGEIINDRDGYLEVLRAERRRFTQQMKEWETVNWESLNPPEGQMVALTGGQLLSIPKRAHWWAIHHDCHPNIEADAYDFEISRIRTYPDVIDWTSHLMSKRWFNDTDWGRLLRNILIAGPNNPISTVLKHGW